MVYGVCWCVYIHFKESKVTTFHSTSHILTHITPSDILYSIKEYVEHNRGVVKNCNVNMRVFSWMVFTWCFVCLVTFVLAKSFYHNSCCCCWKTISVHYWCHNFFVNNRIFRKQKRKKQEKRYIALFVYKWKENGKYGIQCHDRRISPISGSF